jgi:hypothetical protein
MPGSPVGNIENSLCTLESLTCPDGVANLQSRVVQLFFRRGFHPPAWRILVSCRGKRDVYDENSSISRSDFPQIMQNRLSRSSLPDWQRRLAG